MSKNTLNKKELFEELQSAIEYDKRYWVVNDTKIRAIGTAKNYDEFRDTVAAAHLTPVSKQDKAKNTRTWNCTATKTTDIE